MLQATSLIYPPLQNMPKDLDAALKEIESLRRICYEAYQFVAAAGGNEQALAILLAAAEGTLERAFLPHDFFPAMRDAWSLNAAHDHSSNHREEILASESCGCFNCLAIYPPSAIDEWIIEDDRNIGQTGLCPKCDIDSVIGDRSGYPITEEFLGQMHLWWFSNSKPI